MWIVLGTMSLLFLLIILIHPYLIKILIYFQIHTYIHTYMHTYPKCLNGSVYFDKLVKKCVKRFFSVHFKVFYIN